MYLIGSYCEKPVTFYPKNYSLLEIENLRKNILKDHANKFNLNEEFNKFSKKIKMFLFF